MMDERKPVSTRVLLVVLRRLEQRKVDAARAWDALRGDLRNGDKIRSYVTALRKCERLSALVMSHPITRAAGLN